MRLRTRAQRAVAVVAVAPLAVLFVTTAAQAAAADSTTAADRYQQTVSGRVETTSRAPVAGQAVTIDVLPALRGRHATVVGRATTDARGRWSFKVAMYRSLPQAARRAAAVNMGYLNVEAIADGDTSGNTGELALAAESAWVGTAARTVPPSSDTPAPRVMRFTRVAVSAPATAVCCGRFGCPQPYLARVLARGHAYTVVGEYHAYWNASGGLTYTRGATTTVGSYVSFGKGPFTLQGHDNFTSSQSLTMGFPSNGSYNSHQMVVSFAYRKTLWKYKNREGQLCGKWRQVDEHGLYDPGYGWVLFKKGASVIRWDGRRRYEIKRRTAPRDIDTIPRGGAFSLDHGKALTYGVAADVFGIGVQAETTHSADVAQDYQAGNSRRRRHHVWGNDGNLAGYPHFPNVEFSY